MFKRYLYNRFTWQNIEPYNNRLIEQAIFNRDIDFVGGVYNGNLVLTNKVNKVEFNDYYGFATKVDIQLYKGKIIATGKFVLMYDRLELSSEQKILKYYTDMLQQCDKALQQRLKGAELLLSIQARSYDEKRELDKLFLGFDGVKINTIKIPNSEIEIERQPADITQYNISMSDTESLTRIKQVIEAELFSRFGVYDGISKTHVTDANNRNLSTSDSLVLDFEYQARQDFCNNLNKMFGTNISVDINKELKEQQDDIQRDKTGLDRPDTYADKSKRDV